MSLSSAIGVELFLFGAAEAIGQSLLADASGAAGNGGPGADTGFLVEVEVGRASVQFTHSVDAVNELVAVGFVGVLEVTVTTAAVSGWLRLLCNTPS